MSDLTERELGEQLKREAMDSDKRGNPPFEPSSYAAGLERRVKRLARWGSRAREAARWMLDGTDHEKEFAARWWREQLDQPSVVASADTRPKDEDPLGASLASGAVGNEDCRDAQPGDSHAL